MPKNNQPFDGRVSKQNQQGSQKTVLPNKSVEERHLSDALLLKILPTGASISFAGSVAPNGWFIEDGSILKQAEYPELFLKIGIFYNTGGEAGDEFRLPDSRGRVDLGVGTGTSLTTRNLTDILGEESHLLIVAEMPQHDHSGTTANQSANHSYSMQSHTHRIWRNQTVSQIASPTNVAAAGTAAIDASGGGGFGDHAYVMAAGSSPANHGATGAPSSGSTGTISASHNHTFTTANVGGSTSHNNMQPSIAKNKIIKF